MRPILLATSLALAPLSAAQTTLATFEGPAFSSASPVTGGYDLNGDQRDDVIVGAPEDDTSAGQAGAVRAYSGATGALLWERHGANGQDGMGWALAMSPDRDGDGVRDVAVGVPFALQSGTHRPGCLMILSGATGATLALFWGVHDGGGMGLAVTADFDFDRDGIPDFAAGAPYVNSGSGMYRIWSGSTGLIAYTVFGTSAMGVGAALASIGDYDLDGFKDLAAGGPGHDGNGTDRGIIWVKAATPLTIPGQLDYEGLGSALSKGPDIDLDGRPDLLAGLANSDEFGTETGLVRAYNHLGGVLRAWGGDAPGDRFGTSLAEIGDVDGDGFRDFVAGATEASSGTGYARVISARFGVPLYDVRGEQAWTNFGSHVADAGDVNGDGLPDFAAGNPDQFGVGKPDAGRVVVFSGACPGFVNYCTAGVSASGCAAQISASGTPSSALALPFTLQAANVEGQKDGLFFFGWSGRQANPWGNGTSFQCVEPPVKRGGLLVSTGTPGACDGAFSQDLNALWQASPNKNPGAGAVVQAQLWHRDPMSTSNQTTSLSNAIEFAVCP